MTNAENKKILIDRVMELATFWEASATASAIDAVRNPNDKEKMATAVKILNKSDERREVCLEVCELIHVHWPKTIAEKEPKIRRTKGEK